MWIKKETSFVSGLTISNRRKMLLMLQELLQEKTLEWKYSAELEEQLEKTILIIELKKQSLTLPECLNMGLLTDILSNGEALAT